jgi:hypothetical protein
VICVENFRSLTLASTRGVTLPLNRASKANGIDGSGVGDGAGEATDVDVGNKTVAVFSGFSTGTGV